MKKGDMVKVSYTGMVEGNLIETTDKGIAKKNDAYKEGKEYKPAVIVVGEGMVLPGLDRALEEMKVGEKKKLSLTAKDAFGERRSDMIRLVPMREFRAQKVNPFPGMVFEAEGRPARVQSVSGGRVRVDFNHPLAGKGVEYELEIEETAKTEDERVKYLLERAFKDTTLKYTMSGAKDAKGERKIVVDVPEAVAKQRYYPIMRAVFKVEAQSYLGVKEVEYSEPGKVAEAGNAESAKGAAAEKAVKKLATARETPKPDE